MGRKPLISDEPNTVQPCGFMCEECPFPDCKWNFSSKSKAKAEALYNRLQKKYQEMCNSKGAVK